MIILSIFEQVTEGINQTLGIGDNETIIWQVMLRAIVIYMLGLLLIRTGAKRFLGKNTAYDVILGIIFGSVVSRAINSNAPFWGTVMAAGTLIALHWIAGYLSFRYDSIGTFIKGNKRVLVKNGEIDWEEMENSSISKKDLMRAIRSNGSIDDIDQVKTATLERSGEISIVKKKGEPRILDIEIKEGVQRVRIEIG